MAHIRKPLAAAVAINTAVCAGEAVAGIRAGSLSLLTDAVHNSSDELALVCLLAAFISAVSLSRGLQRAANLLNSVGLAALSAVLIWQSLERLVQPRPVVGWIPIGVGALAALGNWGVARSLRDWRHHSAAIRLAYLHNVGDIYVSLAPILAGLLVSISGLPIFDPLMAIAIGLWLIGSTIVELRGSAESLLWPETATCPHEEAHGV
ncbi:MAG TPA: cation diffusion facilitator family transporter [Myxococcota bacterium]|nr:cation diffusion facilitator family transporter [Myxococcota bacterium]